MHPDAEVMRFYVVIFWVYVDVSGGRGTGLKGREGGKEVHNTHITGSLAGLALRR